MPTEKQPKGAAPVTPQTAAGNALREKTYRIREICIYSVEANSAEEAEKLFLDAGSITRDAMLVEVEDREVYAQ
jgi:hypothetical protein